MQGTAQLRKPRQQSQPDNSPFSTDLRELSALISDREFEKVLHKINGLLPVATSSTDKALLLSTVGDLEMKQNKYEEAELAYRKAAEFGVSDPHITDRISRSILKALFQQGRLDEASALAKELLQTAAKIQIAYTQALERIPRQLQATQQASIPVNPPSYPRLALQLGHLFLRFGGLGEARDYYTAAVESSTERWPKAKIALAALLMKTGNREEACQLALNAVLASQFRASSLYGIRIAILNATAESLPSIIQKIKNGLPQATPTVRDRGTLELVRSLKDRSDSSWSGIANEWLSIREGKSPVLATEMRKLLIGLERQKTDNAAGKMTAAENLLALPFLTPREFLMGAAEKIRAQIALGKDPEIESLLVDGCARHRTDRLPLFAHVLGKTCMNSQRFDLATTMFERVLALVPSNTVQWTKSAWALADNEALQDKHGSAALIWDKIAANSYMKPAFRITARLNWLDSLKEAGNENLAQGKEGEVRELASQVLDFNGLMLVSRGLLFAPRSFKDIGGDCLARAAKDFQLDGSKAVLSDNDIRMLGALTLTQLNYQRFDDIFSTWDHYVSQFKSSSFHPSDRFWFYTAQVTAAKAFQEDWSGANDICQWATEHPEASSVGKMTIWGSLGERLAKNCKIPPAFDLFKNVDQEPENGPVEAAYAYYWLALEAYKNGDSEVAGLAEPNLR